MSSSFGQIVKISLFGESHGPGVGMVIDGLPAGIKIDEEEIRSALEKRKPHGRISTSRSEEDEVEFLSGVFKGYTTGSPLCFVIRNRNTDASSYPYGQVRPSHADWTAEIKYRGFEDYRGGGHFSGRLTAPIAVLGAICSGELKKRGILVGTHIAEIGGILDDPWNEEKLEDQIRTVNEKRFAVINEERGERMIECIETIRKQKDSVGGMLSTAVAHLPAGLGEPFFDSLESVLSHLIFSLGGVKGILFGDGYRFASMKGSQANDELYYREDGSIGFYSNHSGGINGGISSGQTVLFETVIKPTPSIGKAQKSIDFVKKENVDLEIVGRHDPCIVHRIRSAVDALTCYGLYDLLLSDEARNGKRI